MGYFKAWWKSLFSGSGETDELGFPVMKREDILPTPKVKPCKPEKDISEPVFTMINIFKDNPKRFKFSYRLVQIDEYYDYCNLRDCVIRAEDLIKGESFTFVVGLRDRACCEQEFSVFQKFAKHKLYPILGFELNESPNWLTVNELSYICSAITPYFQKRVSRYRELVNYRKERTEQAHKRKTVIDKKKERERLTKLYKGE